MCCREKTGRQACDRSEESDQCASMQSEESSLGAFSKIKDPRFLLADSEI